MQLHSGDSWASWTGWYVDVSGGQSCLNEYTSDVKKERNFLRDQSGMRSQLLTLDHLVQLIDPTLYLHLQSADSTNFFFFFRMLLVWFKREFDWADVLRLWEALWTDYQSSQFHLFFALAILEKHRDVIMNHLKHFDEVLKYSPSPIFKTIESCRRGADLLSSQRIIEYNGPRLHSSSRSIPVPSFPADRRSHRQEKQFPCSTPPTPQNSSNNLFFDIEEPQSESDQWIFQHCHFQ